jgi:hypothetical protein
MTLVVSALKKNECLVYSFGIAEEDLYTDYMASLGCSVFAFDPTVNHPNDWKPNVKFFPWGIRNSAAPSEDTNTEPAHSWTHPIYGDVSAGTLYTMPEIVQKLGHQSKTITALKFDCEGCEYGAFQDIYEYEVSSKQKFNKIHSLSTEFHLSTTLGMSTKQDIANIYYASAFLESQKCEAVHYKKNKGYKRDRTVHPILVDVGVPDGQCCYEYGFTCNN